MTEIASAYEILGLDASASPRELHEAYTDLAKIWHPDRFSHDPRLQLKAQEKMKEINAAYETLMDYFRNGANVEDEEEEEEEDESEYEPDWESSGQKNGSANGKSYLHAIWEAIQESEKQNKPKEEKPKGWAADWIIKAYPRLIWLGLSILGAFGGKWLAQNTTPGSLTCCLGIALMLASLPGLIACFLILLGITIAFLIIFGIVAGVYELAKYFIQHPW